MLILEEITPDALKDKSASFTRKPSHRHRLTQERHVQSLADRTQKKSNKTTTDELFSNSSSRPSSVSDSPTKKKSSTSSHESEHQSSVWPLNFFFLSSLLNFLVFCFWILIFKALHLFRWQFSRFYYLSTQQKPLQGCTTHMPYQKY